MTTETFAEKFKLENANKWIWYNGAMGLTGALLNNYVENSRGEAISKMANRDSVSVEDVENDYNNWYYIVPVEEIENEYLNEYAYKYLDDFFERK